MVEKKSVSQEWPQIVGDYVIGDVESAVARRKGNNTA